MSQQLRRIQAATTTTKFEKQNIQICNKHTLFAASLYCPTKNAPSDTLKRANQKKQRWQNNVCSKVWMPKFFIPLSDQDYYITPWKSIPTFVDYLKDFTVSRNCILLKIFKFNNWWDQSKWKIQSDIVFPQVKSKLTHKKASATRRK